MNRSENSKSETNAININDLVKRYEYVEEASELVGIWGFHIAECDEELKIKVYKESTPIRYPYLGIANLGIKNPEQAGFYRSIHPQQTVAEALEDALDGFFAYWNPEKADLIKIKVYEDW